VVLSENFKWWQKYLSKSTSWKQRNSVIDAHSELRWFFDVCLIERLRKKQTYGSIFSDRGAVSAFPIKVKDLLSGFDSNYMELYEKKCIQEYAWYQSVVNFAVHTTMGWGGKDQSPQYTIWAKKWDFGNFVQALGAHLWYKRAYGFLINLSSYCDEIYWSGLNLFYLGF
jgi:hypothetical protein